VGAPLVEIDDGWDYKVLILDDAWVVRWPRHRLAVEEIEREVELLPALAPLLPVEVPRFEYVSRQPWLVAYRLIRGEPLVAEDPDGVRAFLAALHAVDVEAVPRTGPTGSRRIASRGTSSGASCCRCSTWTSARAAKRCSARSRR
jgi:aminoglycoside phosphotransferase (APT) family kinase protein